MPAFTYLKMVKNAVAAVMTVNPELTYDQVLNGFQNDIRSGNQSLAVNDLDYLSSLKVNTDWKQFSFLRDLDGVQLAQNRSGEVANLKSQMKNFKILLNLKFTPNEALGWLQKLRPNPEKTLHFIQIAIARIANMMEQHEDFIVAADRIFDKDNDNYMGNEGLERWHLQELLSPAMKEELLINAKVSNLEHIFEETNYVANKTALEMIATLQVKSGNYHNEAYPELMRMIAAAKVEIYGDVMPQSTINSTDIMITSPNAVTPATLLSSTNAMIRANPSGTIVLAVFFLAAASCVCGFLASRPSIFKYVSGKIMGCFSNKEAGQTYIPVSQNDSEEDLVLDSSEDESDAEEENNRGCFRRCFYSRSTEN
ncbi:MAG: hypothetical protein V4501_04520 [Pseudomonadota bacterium]